MVCLYQRTGLNWNTQSQLFSDEVDIHFLLLSVMNILLLLRSGQECQLLYSIDTVIQESYHTIVNNKQISTFF